MDMQHVSQRYGSTNTLFQHMQQENDALYVMLKQPNKSALMAKLDSGFFSQKTLHSLLYNAFLDEGPAVVAMMLTTASYASEVVLANIIVVSLVNEQEKFRQGENDQERFVLELLKDKSLKVKVLIKALDTAAEKGLKWNNNLPLTEKLIELAVLSAEEKEQIAVTSQHIAGAGLPEKKSTTNLVVHYSLSPPRNPAIIYPGGGLGHPDRPTFRFAWPEEYRCDILDLSGNYHSYHCDSGFSKVDDHDLKSLYREPRYFHTLDLRGSEVTGHGLAHLKKLTNLRILILNNGTAYDGMKHLGKLTQLCVLGLGFENINRELEDKMKKYLKEKIPNLRIEGATLSAEAFYRKFESQFI